MRFDQFYGWAAITLGFATHSSCCCCHCLVVVVVVLVVVVVVVARFLVSFVVDARGAVMVGRRHAGLRFIIPPLATSHPTRVQCKLVSSTTRLSCPPPLSEAEALATRVIDFGSTRVKFDR